MAEEESFVRENADLIWHICVERYKDKALCENAFSDIFFYAVKRGIHKSPLRRSKLEAFAKIYFEEIEIYRTGT